MAESGDGAPGESSAGGLLAAVPLYAPEGGRERGRISATGTEPGTGVPGKVVVDFGWHSARATLDLEIATRRFTGEPGTAAESQRRLRVFCAEREFLERQVRGLADPGDPGAAAAAVWASTEISVDGVPLTFTELRTPHAWVAAAEVAAPFLVRLFAPERPEGLHALRRITDSADLEPVRGRG